MMGRVVVDELFGSMPTTLNDSCNCTRGVSYVALLAAGGWRRSDSGIGRNTVKSDPFCLKSDPFQCA